MRCFGSEGEQSVAEEKLMNTKVEMPRGGGPASPVRCFGSEGEQSVAEEKLINTKVEMPRGGGPASPVRCVCSNGRQSIAEIYKHFAQTSLRSTLSSKQWY